MLHAPALRLETPTAGDLRIMLAAASDPQAQRWLGWTGRDVVPERDREHLLALPQHDRYLRFGYAASDEQVQRYVDGLDFERDELFGIYNRRLELIAMAHLAFAPADQQQDCAEFGVSVAVHARGRGYGARLFERAVVVARNEGVGRAIAQAVQAAQDAFGGRGGGRGGRGGGRGGALVADEQDQLIYAPTYYPGVGSAAEARSVMLGVSQELSDIDFTLRLVPTARVSGHVATSEAASAAQGNVQLTPQGGSRVNGNAFGGQ